MLKLLHWKRLVVWQNLNLSSGWSSMALLIVAWALLFPLQARLDWCFFNLCVVDWEFCNQGNWTVNLGKVNESSPSLQPLSWHSKWAWFWPLWWWWYYQHWLTWPLRCWHPNQACCERDQPQIHCRREPIQSLRSSPGRVVDVDIIKEDGAVDDDVDLGGWLTSPHPTPPPLWRLTQVAPRNASPMQFWESIIFSFMSIFIGMIFQDTYYLNCHVCCERWAVIDVRCLP